MEPLLFLDASALVKRYVREDGSDVVRELFDPVSPCRMATTLLTYAETFSILLRRRNGGIIRPQSFEQAASALQSDVIDDSDFLILTLDDEAIVGGLSLMRRHNVNATDAAFLAAALRFQREDPSARFLRIIASDKRLVRGARSEGRDALDPEEARPEDVRRLLAEL